MKEIWKECPHFPRYEVSSLGRIRLKAEHRKGHKPPHIRSNVRSGYRFAVLFTKYPFCKTVAIAPLICEAFHGPRPIGPDGKPMQVHHKYGKNDNRACALQWVTQSENIKHAYDTGANKGALGKPSRHLSHEQHAAMKVLAREGLSQVKIAKLLFCTNGTVSKIIAGKMNARIWGVRDAYTPSTTVTWLQATTARLLRTAEFETEQIAKMLHLDHAEMMKVLNCERQPDGEKPKPERVWDVPKIKAMYASGLSINRISEKLRASPVKICAILQENGIKIRDSREYNRAKIDEKELKRQYVQEKRSLQELAHIFKRRPSQIRKFLVRQGVRIRSLSEAMTLVMERK